MAGTEQECVPVQRVMLTAWLGAVSAGLRALGRPVEIDGQRLDSVEQAMLVMMQLLTASAPAPRLADLRSTYERLPNLVGLVPDPAVLPREVIAAGVPCRLYVPPRAGSAALVFAHGGGWLLGSPATHDALCRFVATRLQLTVLSVGYRLAPEHIFPAAYDDVLAAYRWLRRGGVPGLDPAKIAIGGDSAGGNLAAAVAIATVEEGAPCATWLLYPALDLVDRPPSAELFAQGFLLTRDMAERCVVAYAPDGIDRADPRLSPLRAAGLGRLGPSVVATAGFDPLRDQGLAWVAALREAGVPVTPLHEAGLTHGFADFAGVIPAARAAVERAVNALGVVMAEQRAA